MYLNINTALVNIVAGFESDRRVDGIMSELMDQFSHFEMTTINQALAYMKVDEVLEAVYPDGRMHLSEIMDRFFCVVQSEL